MATLDEKLMEDLKGAMRAHDERRVSAIRMVRNAIKNAEIDKRGPLDDVAVAEILAREVRVRREAIEEARKAGRADVVEKEEAGLAIVLQYLPQQLSREEIAAEARKVIGELGARGPTDRGKVMGKLMPLLRGKAEGRLVNEVVSELLSR